MNKIGYVTIVYGSVFGEIANANMDPCLGSSCNLQSYRKIIIKNDSAYTNIFFILPNGRTLAFVKMNNLVLTQNQKTPNLDNWIYDAVYGKAEFDIGSHRHNKMCLFRKLL